MTTLTETTTRRRLLAAVAVLATTGLVASPRAEATAAAAFHTPDRKVECLLPVNYAEGATTPWRLMCWRPADGFTVEMSYGGRVRRTTLKRLGMSAGYVRWWSGRSRLRFGKDWTISFDRRGYGILYYECSSRTDGLTCRNRAGHGWWLGRNGRHRLF